VPNRPLVNGSTTRREMRIAAAAGAVAAVGASATLNWPAPVIVVVGLVFTAAYSVRPVRLVDRGVVAPMLLPAAYVAVPYLLGIIAVRSVVHARDLLLLAGLYAGFIGRIVLKDFRDVRGDALFGKRTFLLRHGRVTTCVLSMVSLIVGVSTLVFVRQVSIALVGCYAALLIVTLVWLRALATSTSARRDESLIAGIAIVGRGMLVTLYAHFAMIAAHVSVITSGALLGVLTVIVVSQAREMVARGPIANLTAPVETTKSCVTNA